MCAPDNRAGAGRNASAGPAVVTAGRAVRAFLEPYPNTALDVHHEGSNLNLGAVPPTLSDESQRIPGKTGRHLWT